MRLYTATAALAGLLSLTNIAGAYAADNYLLLCRTADDLDCVTLALSSSESCEEAARSLSKDLKNFFDVNAWCINKLNGEVNHVEMLSDTLE